MFGVVNRTVVSRRGDTAELRKVIYQVAGDMRYGWPMTYNRVSACLSLSGSQALAWGQKRDVFSSK